ncbi:hypothetical protein [Sulfurovum sp.]|uniref:hypothetical protein n=1 Tax=Sulfurovum sp. TaxID=1969726 RepID=UPI0025F41A60|nr:hypothetical protein [Sulfurovum sp.]
MRTENIEEAVIHSKEGKDVAFVITSTNKYSLFKVCYYEIKHRTRSEFRTIVYNKKKDLLYYMLRFVHIITFGHYNLVYEYDDVDSQ